jgi:signal transduction histidine kinase/ligand-binding sensor domain-containing protein
VLRIFLITVLACVLNMFMLWAQSTVDPERRIQFDHLRVEQGLSQGSIGVMLQDRKGFLWIGTEDGLNRFDGYQFLVFRPDPDGELSLASNTITALAEDADGRIWIGTSGTGYQSYDPATRSFSSHTHRSSDGSSLASSVITTLRADRLKRIWIGTDAEGLHVFDPATGSLTAQQLPGTEKRPHIHEITETRSGKLVIAAGEAGLWLVDPVTGGMRRLLLPTSAARAGKQPAVFRVHVQSDRYLWVAATERQVHRHDVRTGQWKSFDFAGETSDLYAASVQSMTMDTEEQLWIATPGLGLILLDARSGKIRRITENRMHPDALPSNSLRCVYLDRLGNIWVGTNGSGLALHSPAAKEFNLIAAGSYDGDPLSVYSFRAIFQDADSVLWLGGYGGFNKLDRRTRKVTSLGGGPAHSLPGTIYSLLEDPADPQNFLIIGTEGSGLFRMDKRNGRVRNIWPNGERSEARFPGLIYEIAATHDKVLWIGTSHGILRWDRNNANSLPEAVAAKEFTERQGGIFSILEDSNGFLWLGTGRSGLAYYDRLNGQVTYFMQQPGNESSISSNNIKCMYEDSRGMLWIGTSGGLNLMDEKRGTFRRFTTEDGLPNNVIYGILEDVSGYLWLSTNQGLARFHPDEGVVGVYDVHDGLQGNEFNTAAFFRSMSGELFFGGVQGVTHFYPERITRNHTIPPIVLTSVRAGNRDLILHSSKTGSDTITLDEGVESITITFAALSFYRPEKNRYRYRIEGRSDEFIDLGYERTLGFARLSPGTYVLQIQGSNNDGVWNMQGLTLTFVIEPPYWATWWFRLLIGLLSAVVVFVGLRWRIGRVRRQEIALTTEVEHRTSELQHANAKLLLEIDERKKAEAQAYRANATKSEFLAHISHEIRTPMNAILGFTELLQDKIRDSELREYLHSIYVSGRNLLTLINDMLDLSRIEAGKLELVFRPSSIRGIIDEIRQLFAYQVQTKNLTFDVRIGAEVPMLMYLDETRVRQILLNLVGNAVKFTNKGSIQLDAVCTDGGDNRCTLTLSVKDTGIGIAPSQQDRVFEPFRQGGSAQARNTDYNGTGLGLAITQRLVQMMDGEIRLVSRLGVGTTFRVTLPAVLVASDTDAFDFGKDAAEVSKDVVSGISEAEVQLSDGNEISSSPELLRALHQELVNSEHPRWERLKRTYLMHEIEIFADDMHNKAGKASYTPLMEWSDRLMRQARSFDMERLPITLEEFPQLLAVLSELGNDAEAPPRESTHD